MFSKYASMIKISFRDASCSGFKHKPLWSITRWTWLCIKEYNGFPDQGNCERKPKLLFQATMHKDFRFNILFLMKKQTNNSLHIKLLCGFVRLVHVFHIWLVLHSLCLIVISTLDRARQLLYLMSFWKKLSTFHICMSQCSSEARQAEHAIKTERIWKHYFSVWAIQTAFQKRKHVQEASGGDGDIRCHSQTHWLMFTFCFS